MATGSDTALHCFSDTGRANESKTEREAERRYKKERQMLWYHHFGTRQSNELAHSVYLSWRLC